jgi:anhydro-N-acetylmuramic acid kinase
MKIYKAIGIMSGTSLDGLDIAYCEFFKKGNKWSYNIKAASTIGYSVERKNKLTGLMKSSSENLVYEDAAFGKFIGKQVKKFIQNKRIKPAFISSHGHTVFHQPKRNFTFQLGSGAAIHAVCNLPVVSDLRSVDVSLDGQGAPLVPIGDQLLFGQYDFCLNLGGISNISFKNKSKRMAFDISPVNIVMNVLAANKGFEFDKDGKLAAAGKIDTELLNNLNGLPFYKEKFPKSLGKEWIDENIFPMINAIDLSIEDKLATFCEHIAIQIQVVIDKALKNSHKTKSSLLITGGGAFNKFLISRIKDNLKSKMEVIVPDKNTVMFKEALIFAFLGVLRIRNENNALSSVTGASRDNIGGALYGKIPY